jgi:hypothetical protein
MRFVEINTTEVNAEWIQKLLKGAEKEELYCG